MEEIRFEILQLKDEFRERRFRGLRELSQKGFTVNAEQYKQVYSGVCPPDVLPDDIFARFNLDRPEDFHGWSLSVGDVILLHQSDGSHAYFVDSFGFEEISGFAGRHILETLPAQETQEPPRTMLISVRRAARDEQNFAYTQDDATLAASGAIGHLRVDMGQGGEEFYADWTDHAANGVPDGFNAYFDALISALRTNPAFDKMLESREALSRYCYGHRGGRIPNEDNSYAFRVDGGEYSVLLRLTPNRGEHNVYAYCYSREALDRTLAEMQDARAQAYVPVYRHSAAYAREAGELEAWRASHKENVACREAIDGAIAKYFDGAHLDSRAASEVLDAYGAERMAWVLANSVITKEYNGRFSRGNRAWAQAENIPIDWTKPGYVHNDEFASRSHPAVLDGYIQMARREMETPAVEKSATIAYPAESRQRRNLRESGARTGAEKTEPSGRPSMRSLLREKQAQTRADGATQKQPSRTSKRESR